MNRSATGHSTDANSVTEMSGKADHTDRVALVTGASRNIGRAIAVALASRGARIVVHVGRNRTAGDETAQAIRAIGGQAVVFTGNIALPTTATTLIEQTRAAFGRLDIVVNNVAVRPDGAFETLSFGDWRQVMAICLDAAFLVSQAALPMLKHSDRAAIVNIGCLRDHTGATHRAHVVAAKAWLVGFSLVARLRRDDFAALPRAALAGAVCSLILIGAMEIGAGTLLHVWSITDMASLSLAVAPGGIGEMISSAKAIDAEPAIVAG